MDTDRRGYDDRAVQNQTPGPPAGESADRRTELAANRTVLAAERTYAAWVRTGLTALAAGVGAKAVLGEVLPEWAVLATGTVLVLFGGFCFAAAVWRELRPGAPPPRPDLRRIPPAALLALNGFLILVCVGALLGVWFGETGGK
jgi:putative membrane protein